MVVFHKLCRTAWSSRVHKIWVGVSDGLHMHGSRVFHRVGLETAKLINLSISSFWNAVYCILDRHMCRTEMSIMQIVV